MALSKIMAVPSMLKIHFLKFLTQNLKKNTAMYGGSVYSSNSNVNTDKCEFENNYVWEEGGSIFLDGTNFKDKKSKFENNE